jgi:hypothetical protein
MSSTYSAKLKLEKPATGDRNWDTPLRADLDALDATPLGMVAVATHEKPTSTSLTVDVGAGTFLNSSVVYATFAGTTGYTLPASTTSHVWLTDAGALANGTSWPTAGTFHVRLATVTTSGSVVTAIVDERTFLRSASS